MTVSGSTITKVGIGSIDDGGMQRSQLIDQQAIPILEQEAMQGPKRQHPRRVRGQLHQRWFQQSLQAALQTLGFK